MTYENRLPQNYSFGTLTQAAAISDTTLTSTDFATRLPSGLSTTNYVPMVLQDPSTGNYEVVWVNAHTASATTCTVVRGKESTSARAWANGTLWTVSPTLRDGMLPVANRAALPADPHVGMRAYIQDEQVAVEYVLNVGWLNQSGMAYRANTLLGADTASVTFSSIPSTLKKIQLVWSARSTTAAVNTDLRMRINNNSTGVYFSNLSYLVNTTISNFIEDAGTYCTIAGITAANATASVFASGEWNAPGWNAPGGYLNHQWTSHYWNAAATSALGRGGGMFMVAGPYTRLDLFAAAGNLKAGSEFTIYGWG